MNITFSGSDIVEKYENILIHFGFHVMDFDFRSVFFSDESSMYDMGSNGLNDNDYHLVAKMYYDIASDNDTYSQGQKKYYKLLNTYTDKIWADNFESTYGFSLNKDKHLLKDIILELNDKFPSRNWDQDNIFIIKKFDALMEQRKKDEDEEKLNNKNNIVKFPKRKKLSPEEIKQCTNYFLMVKELGMTYEDAKKLADHNYEKKMEGKKFEPYLPITTTHKNKI